MATRQTIRPRVSQTDHGVPLYARIPALIVDQGTTADFEVICRDGAGNPMDLSQFDDPTATVAFTEAVTPADRGKVTISASIDADLTTGKVTFQLSSEHTISAGIYRAEIGITTAAGLAYVYRFYLTINPSEHGGATPPGPPSIPEIRLHLRDSMPDENYLIDELEFDNAEIAACIRRPVDYFNEILPPIGQWFTTQTFPFREHWIEGIIANLMHMAAMSYRRNRAKYQSQGGAMIDDKNRESEYTKEGERRWEAYKTWAQNIKINKNIDNCWGSVGSAYDLYH